MATIADAARLERLASEEGERYGPELLKAPPSQWRRLMKRESRYRRFGVLRYLLGEARKRFETEPSIAREITAAVIAFVFDAEGAPSAIHAIGLRGLAWKEHANALEYTGDLRVALRAAERAVRIYGDAGSLKFDQTKARLVVCNIYRDLGQTDKALAIARQCALLFSDYADSAFRTMARMSEGTILFAQKRFAEALEIFTALVEQGEREGDKLTVARGLQNAAECARELGDLKAARDLYPRARRHFEDLELPTEVARVMWGYALSLAAEGMTRTAISELFKVSAVYLGLGANVSAATSRLDMVRIGFEAGDDVRELCSELVTTLTNAGLTQNAVEALAYLREQAKRRDLTTEKIAAVRTFFGELTRTPTLSFVRPAYGEEVGS